MRNGKNLKDPREQKRHPGTALPEPRIVKREILRQRNVVEDDIIEMRKKNNTHLIKEVFGSLSKLFMKLETYMKRFSDNNDYTRLNQLGQMLEDGVGNPDSEDAKRFVQAFRDINDLIYELGITDIGIEAQDSQPFGHDFLRGLAMDINTKYAAWERLKENMRNMTKLLEQDGDFMVVITSETSGLGKSTLMAALLEDMNEEQNRDCGEQNLVFTDEDFWNAFELPPRSTAGIDEGPRLFYNKDAIKANQKKRKKKIKTGRYKNIGLMACFHDFYDLDKEIINTNVNANIHVPRKGYFEFYSKKQIEEFEKDDNGKCQRNTEPEFEGYFRDYSGEMWKIYKNNEEKKDRGIKNQGEEEDSGNNKSAHCNRCGYDWTPRKKNIEDIKMCAKCGSRKWNEPQD